MHAHTDSLDDMMRDTVEAAVELSNSLDDGSTAVREVLVAYQFSDAASASDAELARLVEQLQPLALIIRSLSGTALAEAVEMVNAELARAAVAPTLSAHDGAALHLHWTRGDASFADRVAIDVAMALAQALCDCGTDRFGRCAADDCERVFYDSTKNRSRRFCSDSRCASRTHTAAHRARNS